jgi:hypothetical protein
MPLRDLCLITAILAGRRYATLPPRPTFAAIGPAEHHLFCLFYQVEIRSPPSARGPEDGSSNSAAVLSSQLGISQSRDYVNTAFGERADTLAISAKA